MKILFRHIFLLVCIISIYACSENELDTQVLPQNGCINFIARPTSFQGYDVAVVPSKSLSLIESNKITQFENKIQSAYFIIFGSDGNRIGDVVSLTVTDNIIQPYSLYHNYNKGPLTVCFIANVPEDYVKSIDHTDDFENIPLDNISYDSYQTDDKDVVIVPKIGESNCIPMFGCITQSYENGVLSGVTQDANGNYIVTVPIWRLFSRVNVNLQVKTSSSLFFNKSNFSLNNLSVNNLPTKVRLKEMTEGEESTWVQTASAFHAPLILNPDIKIENGTYISSPSFDLVCYVPEYCLKPEAGKVAEVNGMSGITEKQKQKYKPNLYDLSKHPVHLNIVGKSSQPNFVDVPLEYNIFLGDNEFDSFSFYRNKIYNNNISINGMGDAILGNDDRVEAKYHNLANPDNSGVDVPANCYIISKPGRYLIPTYIGNNVSGGTQIGGHTVAPASHINGNTSDAVSNVCFLPADHEDNSLGQDCIMFDVNMYDANNVFSPVDVAGSNKLICLKNEQGNIIWSWHLWLCQDVPKDQTYPGNVGETITGAIVMDRAIGALNSNTLKTVWTDGLYYQWGRKDPLISKIPQTGGSYTSSIMNPTTLYSDWTGSDSGSGWISIDGTKSVNDPCPPGYRIPSADIWLSEAPNIDDSDADKFVYSTTISAEISEIYYPYSSYILPSTGNILVNENVQMLDKDGSTELKSSPNTILGHTWYVKYSGTQTIKMGQLWSTLGCLYYDSQTFNIDENEASIVVSGRLVNNSYSVSAVKSIPLIGNRIADTVVSIMENAKASKKNYSKKVLGTGDDKISASTGTLVRCVSESSSIK